MESLAHYTITEHVGRDAVADVYRAKDTSLGRTVTIRVLRPEIAADQARCDRLLAGARAALALSHPGIAALFQVGDADGKPFVVFEHAPGETLRAAAAGSPLNLRRAVDLGVQIADALADAHAQGFVHGALNPDAIVVTQKGRVKLVGFGLPLVAVDQPIQSGTPLSADEVECLAPECVLGGNGDARADIFSFGCVLFEMLTGRQPFGAPTAADAAVAILGRTPPPPSQLNAQVPAAIDAVVERCLAKSVQARSDNAATIAAALRESLAQMEEEDQSAAAPAQVPVRQPRRRRSLWFVVLLIVLCLAAVAAAWLLR